MAPTAPWVLQRFEAVEGRAERIETTQQDHTRQLATHEQRLVDGATDFADIKSELKELRKMLGWPFLLSNLGTLVAIGFAVVSWMWHVPKAG